MRGSTLLSEDGSLHLVRTDEVRDLIRSSGKRLIATHREALAILADHDRGSRPRASSRHRGRPSSQSTRASR